MNKEENKTLEEVIKLFSNDFDLASYFRNNYLDISDVQMVSADRIIHKFDDDKELGAYLRASHYHIVTPYA